VLIKFPYKLIRCSNS